MSIPLSRRISHANGFFAGIVLIDIQLEYFQKLFSELSLGTHGAQALKSIGRNISSASTFKQFMAAPEGSFSDTSYIDGARRLYFFKTLPNLPFIIMVAKAHSDIYAVWRHRTLLIASVMGTLTLAFIGLSCDFGVQLKRKIRTQAEPAMVARTDGLTGLSNRRKLDEILDQEWRRATRHQSTLSLLVVDIDCFRAYNDNDGHQAGDTVLATVAKRIANNIRRPGDGAARYGGEEFLVVLPDTSSDGEEFIAENIRLAICKLAIEHTESAFGHITVSIGSATWGPERTDTDPLCRRGALQRQDDWAQQGSLVSTTQMLGAAGPPLIGTAAFGQLQRCKRNGSQDRTQLGLLRPSPNTPQRSDAVLHPLSQYPGAISAIQARRLLSISRTGNGRLESLHERPEAACLLRPRGVSGAPLLRPQIASESRMH